MLSKDYHTDEPTYVDKQVAKVGLVFDYLFVRECFDGSYMSLQESAVLQN